MCPIRYCTVGRQQLEQFWDMLQVSHRQFTLAVNLRVYGVLNVSISYSHHLYLTLLSHIIVFCGALECKTHLSWSVRAGQQQPPIAVHFVYTLCLSSQVWRTIFISFWAAALMCAMFFTCYSSFHFIPWAGLLWRSAIWLMCLCVFGCFGGGFKRLFFIFASVLKENPLGFHKLSVPHSLTARMHLNGKQCLFECSLMPEKQVFYKLL